MASELQRRSGVMTAKGFRLDLQGLRGLMLVLVLACHAELPFFEGGFIALDVFYVLSGFLITGLLVREIERTGTLSIRDFYARRARRLLPLAGTVLAVTAAGSLALFSTARIEEIAGDIVAAALYVVNWRFMTEGVDYFEEGPDVSVVQHYWSLSVEEQFYLVWPVLLLAALWYMRSRGGGFDRRRLMWMITPLGLASLAYSIRYSAIEPDAAYFSTLTRVWQLAAGAMLALALPAGLRMARAASRLLTVIGLAVLLGTTALYSEGTAYPGWQAILPVAAACAIICAGTAVKVSAPVALLTRTPLQYLGKISYAWYLWHWPVLIFAEQLWGDLNPVERTLVILAAWVPTIISHHHIEERFRGSVTLARRPRRAIALGLACTAGAVLAGFSMQSLRPPVPTAPLSTVEGALADTREQRSASALRPSPGDATDDKGVVHADGCLVMGKDRRSGRCRYGTETWLRTVVLLGDSKALQYSPTVLELARKNRWRVIVLTRASCPVADVVYQPTCRAWREHALRRIEGIEKLDLVVVATSTDDRFQIKADGETLSREDSQPRLARGFARTLRRIGDTGAEVAVIRDQSPTPRDLPDCVADNLGELGECRFEERRRSDLAYDASGARRVSEVKLIDPLPLLCPEDRCRPVMGNALVYRDYEHLSATFARTLAPWLERRLPRLG